MPKIERSIAYTFDAYSGGMKIDFLGKFATTDTHTIMGSYSNYYLHSGTIAPETSQSVRRRFQVTDAELCNGNY